MIFNTKQVLMGVLLVASGLALPTTTEQNTITLNQRGGDSMIPEGSNMESRGLVSGILDGVASIVQAATGNNNAAAAAAAKGGQGKNNKNATTAASTKGVKNGKNNDDD
ncbi:hypothetical protein S7711_11155 [Stachybotrys chartarum IBT 7711]|uniref:Uncharacterized protein n=1 Tax=Stachybotrys chartarum (strain CBS 109288 / IBT 7711) TaxID=1280523 RepID=A0A084B7E0_STACB|nr:hypothetical protein S7711_11155 [Stachybotrys chartarum IBT 7711]KFA50024.1 hypothetical protein S40293_11014 [Stachybotrys chartarum IBT 40293]